MVDGIEIPISQNGEYTTDDRDSEPKSPDQPIREREPETLAMLYARLAWEIQRHWSKHGD